MNLDVLSDRVLQQVGKDSKAVIRSIGAVVVKRPVIACEADQSQILDSAPFVVGIREDDRLGDVCALGTASR